LGGRCDVWTHPGFARFRFGDDDGYTNDVAVLRN
jgi:hypothetical protein